MAARRVTQQDDSRGGKERARPADRRRRARPSLRFLPELLAAIVVAGAVSIAAPTTASATASATAPRAGISATIPGGSGNAATLVPAAPAGDDWLSWANWYRQSVGLAALTESPVRTTNAKAHAKYMVDFGVDSECAGYPHCESPGNPNFTAAGDDAGQSSNIVRGGGSITERQAVDGWMAAPFHALGNLNEQLQTSGYGGYNHPDGANPVKGAAAMDVINGINSGVPKSSTPIGFPGNNSIIPLTSAAPESPDPLAPCAGFALPAGLPIIVKFPTNVNVSNAVGTLTQAGNAQQACLTKAADYPNVGGSILSTYNAVLLIPRNPLTPGLPYTYTINAGTNPNASSITSTFTPFGPPTFVPMTGATAGINQASLTWNTPSSNGGRPITGYRIYAYPANGVGSPVVANVGVVNAGTIIGLSPGTKYRLEVHAITDVQESNSGGFTRTLPAVPDAPTNPVVETLATGGRVTWTAPTTPAKNDFASAVPVTSYAVTSSPGNVVQIVNAPSTSLDLTGLQPGVTYTFTVKATNAVGQSVSSVASNSITLPGLPAAPTVGSATAGIRSATVNWTPPPAPSNGTWGQSAAVTGFRVTASPGGTTVDFAPGATSGVVPNLANATAFTFSVKALNPVGTSTASSATNQVITPAVPAAPGSVTATPGNAQATIGWTAPPLPQGGFAVTGYTVTLTPSTGAPIAIVVSVGAAVLSTPVTGLANGTAYTVAVTAVNGVGVGPVGNAVGPVVPRRAPDAPASVVGAPGDGRIDVSWAAPAFDGGAAVSGYTVTVTPAAGVPIVQNLGAGVRAAAFTGLTNGTSHSVVVSVTNVAGTTVAPTVTSLPKVSPRFHSVAPFRVLDSRPAPDGPIGLTGAWGPAQTKELDVTGVAGSGVPATGVSAVVLNVTGVAPSSTTHLTLFPSGEAAPNASHLNLGAGQVRPNLVVVKVGANGNVSIFNNAGTINVLADVVGWYDDGAPAAGGDVYRAVTPFRVEDSREPGSQAPGAWGSGEIRAITVAGLVGSGVPASGVSAVAVNVTGVAPSAGTHITVFPSDVAAPNASNLNLGAGEVAPNMVIVKVGADGKIKLRNNSGNVHLIVDIVGFYVNEPSGGRFTPLSPFRVLDSRPGGIGLSGAWTAAQTRALTVVGVAGSGVPATGVTAVVLNVTGVTPTATTHVTVAPTGVPLPTASNLNLNAGDVRPNLVVVKVGPDGKINLFNNSGSVNLIADVVGFYD